MLLLTSGISHAGEGEFLRLRNKEKYRSGVFLCVKMLVVTARSTLA